MNSKKTLLVNFGSLSGVQILIYTAPLIYLPYLVRIIGPAKYGAVAFAQAVAMYFGLFTDFGISTYAPGKIAVLKQNKKQFSLFISSILFIRTILFIVVSLLYITTVFIVPQFRSEKTLFLFTGTMLFVNAFYPGWLFQGIEKMQYIAYGNLIGKIVYVFLIYLLIKNVSDYIYVPLFSTLSMLTGVFFMYCSAYFKEGIKLSHPSSKHMLAILKESFPLFVSSLSVQVYTGIYTVILGFLTNNTVVGYYSVAEKLAKAFLSIEHQVSTVFYPYISRVIKQSKEKALTAIKKSFSSTLFIAVPASIFTFFYAKDIIRILFGSKFVPGIVPLKIISFIFIISVGSNIFSKNILLPMGKRRELMNATLATSIVSIILNFIFVPLFKQDGSALAFVLSESFVAVCLYINIVKVGMNFSISKIAMLKFGLYSIVLILIVLLLNYTIPVHGFMSLLVVSIAYAVISFVFALLFRIIDIGKKEIVI